MNKYVKSPLNYTGGKYKLLPQIIPLFPNKIDGVFIDLFCGGANVAVNMVDKANAVVANDIDSHIIEIYRYIKNWYYEDLFEVIDKRIEKYGLSMTNKEGYDKFREDYNKSEFKEPIDLFILICYSFNHQIRFNKKGEFNMPFGKDRSCFNNTIRKNLKEFMYNIIPIKFTSKSFDELEIETLNTNSFVYCDPPYLITCATYNEKDGWNETQERKLLDMLDRLNERGIKFALSNVLSNKGRTNDILIEWSKKYTVHHLNNTYANCNYHTKDKNSKADEVLIVNY